jgi:hypothetical protein
MKYLKLFENFNDEYTLSSLDEWQKVGEELSEKSSILIPDDEVNQIQRIAGNKFEVKKMNYVERTHGIFSVPHLVLVRDRSSINRNSDVAKDIISNVLILLSNDEWYYARVSYIGVQSDVVYKCDQFDGLIKLMKVLFSDEVVKNYFD